MGQITQNNYSSEQHQEGMAATAFFLFILVCSTVYFGIGEKLPLVVTTWGNADFQAAAQKSISTIILTSNKKAKFRFGSNKSFSYPQNVGFSGRSQRM